MAMVRVVFISEGAQNVTVFEQLSIRIVNISMSSFLSSSMMVTDPDTVVLPTKDVIGVDKSL